MTVGSYFVRLRFNKVNFHTIGNKGTESKGDRPRYKRPPTAKYTPQSRHSLIRQFLFFKNRKLPNRNFDKNLESRFGCIKSSYHFTAFHD